MDLDTSRSWAEAFADRHGLEPQRIERLLNGMLETKVFPNPPTEELVRATLALGAERAFDILEQDDLAHTGLRVMAYDSLSSPLAPLMTIDELSDLTDQCMCFLRAQADQLLETGMPSHPFRPSAWHDWYLGRLFPTKRPVVIEGSGLSSNALATAIPPDAVRDHCSDRPQYWTRNRPWPPFRLALRRFPHLGTDHTKLTRFTQDPFPNPLLAAGNSLLDDGKPVQFCSYDDAGYIKGLGAQDVAQLETLRESVLEARVRCLEVLTTALEQRETSSIWPECTAVLAGIFSSQQVDWLFEVEGLYGGRPCEWPPLWMQTHRPFFDSCAGLTELLTVIGHVDREIALGTFAATCEEFRSVLPKLSSRSYYHAIASGDEDELHGLLGTHLLRGLPDGEYWERQQAQVDLLWPQFSTEIAEPIRVPQAHAERVKDYLREAGDLAQARIAAGIPLPELASVTEPAEGQPRDYVFCKEGAKWRVVFNGRRTFVDHLKGMTYIAELLRRPGTPIEALTLADGAALAGEVIESIDETLALEEALGLASIDGEISGVDKSDRGVWQELEEKRGELKAEYSKLFNVHGEERTHRRQQENARTSVKKAIDRALNRLDKPLFAHLESTLKTGNECCYAPSKTDTIDWDLG